MPVVAGDPSPSALKGENIAVCTELSIQIYVTYCILEGPRTRISALVHRRYIEVNYVCDAGEDRKALSGSKLQSPVLNQKE